ncbi:MAG: hypothetical protein MR308_07515 [Lachnospiraceae bacterium]|nr:hypothetical protein [Lachnospiraceae bacterium]
MDKKKLNTLFVISSLGLDAAGIIFLCIYLFGGSKNNWMLGFAIACVALSNLFNIIRNSYNKKEK